MGRGDFLLHDKMSEEDLIGQVYEAPLSEGGWASLVPSLEQALSARVAVFHRSPGGVRTIGICTASTDIRVDEYEARLWGQDRALNALAFAPVGEIVLDSQLISDPERLKSDFYNDFLGAAGLGRGIYATFARGEGDALIVSGQRSERAGDYSEEEMALLRRILPHLQRSFRMWRRFGTAQQHKVSALQALDHAGLGYVLVDATGRVRFANGEAERRLRTGALPHLAGCLVGRTREDCAELHRAIRSASRDRGALASSVTLVPQSGHERLPLLVAPVPADGAPLTGERLAMVLLSEDSSRLSGTSLQRVYSLTPAEQRLLSALIAGARLNDYAEQAGISVATAKTHLSALFDKTGVRRQSDLIRLALSDPNLRFLS